MSSNLREETEHSREAREDSTVMKQSTIRLNDELQKFWEKSYNEIDAIDPEYEDFKQTNLPLARIKKIMKIDEDVKMISAEAPVVFAKACELLIQEMSLRGWNYTEENKRRTLQRADISFATAKSDMFDFLIDIIPRDDHDSQKKDEMLAMRSYSMPGSEQMQQMWMQQANQFNNGEQAPGGYPNMMMQQMWQQYMQMMQRQMPQAQQHNEHDHQEDVDQRQRHHQQEDGDDGQQPAVQQNYI